MIWARVFAAAIAFACASGAAGSGGLNRSVMLTAQEISATNTSVTTALDAVQRLRPSWLIARGVRSRGESDSTEYAYVYVDGQPAGKIGALRDIEAHQVLDISYYDVARAQAKFGILGSKSGVIEVRLRNSVRE